MQIIFVCILIFILGIIFSKIKISIEKIELNMSKITFRVKVGFYLFGLIKIFTIECNEIGIKIFGKNIPYKKFLKVNIDKYILEHLKKKDVIELEEMNVKIDSANFTLKLGTEDLFVTVFLVTLIASIIPQFVRKQLNHKKIHYKILPEFNKNEIYYEGQVAISLKTICIISTLKENNKRN